MIKVTNLHRMTASGLVKLSVNDADGYKSGRKTG